MVKLFIYIGKVLENFAQQVGIWKYCMHFIEKTNNEYVIMYCLNVLEVSTVFVKFTPAQGTVLLQRLINHVWPSMNPPEKVEIRVFLLEQLIGRYKVLPAFLRNKMAKVLVDVARVDWPHDYPVFLDNILQVMYTLTVDSVILLVIICTAS